jgi:hypothetical protein
VRRVCEVDTIVFTGVPDCAREFTFPSLALSR